MTLHYCLMRLQHLWTYGNGLNYIHIHTERNRVAYKVLYSASIFARNNLYFLSLSALPHTHTLTSHRHEPSMGTYMRKSQGMKRHIEMLSNRHGVHESWECNTHNHNKNKWAACACVFSFYASLHWHYTHYHWLSLPLPFQRLSKQKRNGRERKNTKKQKIFLISSNGRRHIVSTLCLPSMFYRNNNHKKSYTSNECRCRRCYCGCCCCCYRHRHQPRRRLRPTTLTMTATNK